jgi:hypothetical protein
MRYVFIFSVVAMVRAAFAIEQPNCAPLLQYTAYGFPAGLSETLTHPDLRTTEVREMEILHPGGILPWGDGTAGDIEEVSTDYFLNRRESDR